MRLEDVDLESLSIDRGGNDYPDYCDSYVTGASWKSGTDLNDEELDELNERYPSLAAELIMDDFGRYGI